LVNIIKVEKTEKFALQAKFVLLAALGSKALLR